MADTRLSIAVVAELADFQKALATLPGIGEKEARDMVAGIRRQLKQAETAAKSSAKETGHAFEGTFSGIEALAKRLGEKAGGPFATISGLAIEGSKDVAKMLGPLGAVGTALGGLTAVGAAVGGAFVATGYAAKALADGAAEAADRLAKVGRSVDPDYVRMIEEYAAASKDLGIQADYLTVAIGSELTEGLAKVALAAAGAAREFKEFKERNEELRDNVNEVTWVIRDAASKGWLGWTVALTESKAAQEEAAASTLEMSDAYMALGLVEADAVVDQEHLAKLRRENTEAAKLQTDAERERAEAIKKAAEDALRAEQALSVFRSGQALEEIANETDARVEAGQARIDQINAVRDAETAAVAAEAADRAAYMEAERKALGEQTQARIEADDKQKESAIRSAAAVIGAIDGIMSAYAQLIDQELEATIRLARRQVSLVEKSYDKQIAAAEERFAATDGLSKSEEAVLEQLAAERDAAVKQQRAEERESVLAGFHTSQSWAKAQVYFSGAQATAALAATLAPFLSVGALPAAAALVAPMVATQIAVINRQKPPEFPMGYSPPPDHQFMAAVQRDEGILSRRGVAAVGGPGAVADLNRGVAPAASAQEVYVEVGLDERTSRLRVVQDRRTGKRSRRGSP